MTTPSIDSIGMMNPYMNMMSYDNPYFWAVYNNNNMTTPSFKGTSSTSSDTTTTKTDNSSVQAQLQTESDSGKKKGKTGRILTGIAVIGATAFCIAAAKKGQGANVLERIKDGSGQIFSGLKAKISSSATKPTITNIDGNTIVKIPERNNIIRCSKAAEELGKIGESFTPEAYNNLLDASGKLKQGNQIARLKVNLGDGNFAVWSKGNATSGNKFRIFDSTGKTPANLTADYITNIKQAVSDIASGKGNITDSRISELVLNNTNAKTGLITRVKYTPQSGIMQPEIVSAISNRFPLGHDAVKALGERNPEIKKSINAFIKGKFDQLNITQASIPSSIGKFNIDGKGNILSITQNNGNVVLAGTEKFDALKFDNSELFKTIAEGKNLQKTQVVYQL